jgi:hypothetical protein
MWDIFEYIYIYTIYIYIYTVINSYIYILYIIYIYAYHIYILYTHRSLRVREHLHNLSHAQHAKIQRPCAYHHESSTNRGFSIALWVMWKIPCFHMFSVAAITMFSITGGEQWQVELTFKPFKFQSGWWFGTFFMFHNIWDNPSRWLIFFKMVETTNQQLMRLTF